MKLESKYQIEVLRAFDFLELQLKRGWNVIEVMHQMRNCYSKTAYETVIWHLQNYKPFNKN